MNKNEKKTKQDLNAFSKRLNVPVSASRPLFSRESPSAPASDQLSPSKSFWIASGRCGVAYAYQTLRSVQLACAAVATS